jgi:hypothetical protein
MQEIKSRCYNVTQDELHAPTSVVLKITFILFRNKVRINKAAEDPHIQTLLAKNLATTAILYDLLRQGGGAREVYVWAKNGMKNKQLPQRISVFM